MSKNSSTSVLKMTNSFFNSSTFFSFKSSLIFLSTFSIFFISSSNKDFSKESIFSKSCFEIPVSDAIKTKLSIFFLRRIINSLKRVVAFSSCFFVFAIISEKISSSFRESCFFSLRYFATSVIKFFCKGCNCSEYLSFLAAS